jgi:uncharacterized protein with GYD domain
MSYYVILSNLTDDGRKTIKEHPERILEVNRELERSKTSMLFSGRMTL